jgi:exo-beta-1,3-glucanase (GH17 family)
MLNEFLYSFDFNSDNNEVDRVLLKLFSFQIKFGIYSTDSIKKIITIIDKYKKRKNKDDLEVFA